MHSSSLAFKLLMPLLVALACAPHARASTTYYVVNGNLQDGGTVTGQLDETNGCENSASLIACLFVNINITVNDPAAIVNFGGGGNSFCTPCVATTESPSVSPGGAEDGGCFIGYIGPASSQDASLFTLNPCMGSAVGPYPLTAIAINQAHFNGPPTVQTIQFSAGAELAALTASPEPSAAYLILPGLIALAFRARKRNGFGIPRG